MLEAAAWPLETRLATRRIGMLPRILKHAPPQLQLLRNTHQNLIAKYDCKEMTASWPINCNSLKLCSILLITCP